MKASARLSGLAPVGSPQPRLLILGTFPSPMSRQRQEYYGNPANRFWRLLSAVFGVADFTGGEYVDKIKLLAVQGIALCGRTCPPRPDKLETHRIDRHCCAE